MSKLGDLKSSVDTPSLKQPGMRPLKIQQLLRKGRGYLGIAHEYDLYARNHTRHSNLVQFSHAGYNLSEVLVQQCRGLILDSTNDWKVVARPLDHIFEWSAPEAPMIDWAVPSKNDVVDKVDGVMVFMYHYNGGWQVGSLYSPSADNFPNKEFLTVHDLFWQAFFDAKYVVPPSSFESCTFIWELRGPKIAPVVVARTNQSQNQLNLLAVRHNASGEELDPMKFCDQGIRPYVGCFIDESGFTCTKDVLQAVVDCDLQYGEGYIIRDHLFRRVAVTHPEYETARAFRAKLSAEWLLDNIRARKPSSDVFKYAKDWIPLHHMLAQSYGDLLARLFRIWSAENKNPCDTNFAQSVRQYPFGRLLQQRRNKELDTFGDGLRQVPLPELLSWLEVAGVDEKRQGVA